MHYKLIIIKIEDNVKEKETLEKSKRKLLFTFKGIPQKINRCGLHHKPFTSRYSRIIYSKCWKEKTDNEE